METIKWEKLQSTGNWNAYGDGRRRLCILHRRWKGYRLLKSGFSASVERRTIMYYKDDFYKEFRTEKELCEYLEDDRQPGRMDPDTSKK